MRKQTLKLASFAYLGALFLFLAPGLWASNTWPSLLNYQGRLTNPSGNAVSDGSYSIVFSIYTVASGGSNIWTETQSNVSVSKGLFDAILGSVNPLSSISASSFNADLWIGVAVNGDPEMTPRQQLLASPYARNAQFLMGDTTGTAANNVVVLDGTGKIPAGLVQNGSFSVPFTFAGSSANYVLNVTNTSNVAGTQALNVAGASGIFSQATSASGNAIWGLTAPNDNSSAVAILADSTNGVAIEASSTAYTAISATSFSSTTTLAGVEGVGATGVLGWADTNGGRGVDGEVSALFPSSIAVRGSNASVTGTAIFGNHQGTGAGMGVRGGSPSGVGAFGVFGSVSGATATGVLGFASAADGTGVIGQLGSSSPVSYAAAVYAKAANQNSGIGLRAEAGQAVYGLSNGFCAICGYNNNSSSTNYGVYTQIQSSVAGSSAGSFNAMGSVGQTYGILVSQSSAQGIGAFISGGSDGVHSVASSGGNNYNSDDSGGALYGYYHSDSTAPNNGAGVYSSENGATAYGGFFTNTSATVGSGAAVDIEGRLTVHQSAGFFTVNGTPPISSFTLNNNFIQGNSLIFLTPLTAFGDGNAHVASVTGKSQGQATISFTPALPDSSTVYQYLVIGQ